MKHSLLPRLGSAGLTVLLAVSSACQVPGPRGARAEIRDAIIESIAEGRADDGDSENPPDDYRLPDLDAEDRKTKASSAMPKFNEVSGSVDAVPRDPAAATIVKDLARANSTSRAVTELVVNADGNFTFNTKLLVEGLKLVGQGSVFLNIQALIQNEDGTNILNEEGEVETKASLAQAINFNIRNDDSGSPEVIVNGDEDNPDDAVTDQGTYEATQRGPNGGIDLAAGKYRLEIKLVMTASAPIGRDDDGNVHEAHIEKGTLSVELR